MVARSSTASPPDAKPAPRKRPPPVVKPAPSADAAAASFAALTVKLDYLDAADIRKVREAYRFADEAHLVRTIPLAGWRTLCGRQLDWVETV